MTRTSTDFFEALSVQSDDDCMDCRFSIRHPDCLARVGSGHEPTTKMVQDCLARVGSGHEPTTKMVQDCLARVGSGSGVVWARAYY